jgi:hypothetical protein
MTTIAYRDGVMAADTLMIKGETAFGYVLKIVRRPSDGALCGGAGNLGWVQAFHRRFLADEEGDPPPMTEYDNAIVVREQGNSVEIFEDGGAFEFETDFTAIGSGKDFALAAMHVGADAATAVRTAIHFEPGTGGEVTVLRHDEDDLIVEA